MDVRIPGGAVYLKLLHSALHSDGHPHTGLGVLFDALEFRIAEKHEHGIADELVDSRSMFEGDPGHCREILVQDIRKILRLEILGNLGEILDITEEDGKLFALPVSSETS